MDGVVPPWGLAGQFGTSVVGGGVEVGGGGCLEDVDELPLSHEGVSIEVGG